MASQPQSSPTKVQMKDMVSRILRPALTSHYAVKINPPSDVLDYMKSNEIYYDLELVELSCAEASLPGSSLATVDVTNDFMGVSTKNAYRRLYDDRADFTFYVNHQYDQIKFFEFWMRYITGEQKALDLEENWFTSRVNYPKNYKTIISILKYERDYPNQSGNVLAYNFIDAFPISINSMPISYDSSNLLKVTVSFSYSRYYVDASQKMSFDSSINFADAYNQKIDLSKYGFGNYSTNFNPGGVPSDAASASGNFVLNNNINQTLNDFNSRA
jgi:hypothetical protein